jgi:hypothetical protein
MKRPMPGIIIALARFKDTSSARINHFYESTLTRIKSFYKSGYSVEIRFKFNIIW